jgi:pimeloyl-ACP methyl ester carboxylesterase
MARWSAVNAGAAVVFLAVCLPGTAQNLTHAAPPPSVATVPVKNLARHGFFYVGGSYVGDAGKEIMDGAMYAEVWVPKKIERPYPLVLFHGNKQTATNWLQTPDGREGWADYFLDRGYIVYMVDQPARGRSAYHPVLDGAIDSYPASAEEKLFTAFVETGDWPQAKLHTQWPGEGPRKGRRGDPVFDAFYATQVESLVSNARTQQMVEDAGAKLLDKIGPVILLTHSQAGTFGWLIADARPKLVKGVVAIEPQGPPFENMYIGSGRTRAWGITDIAIHYDPPVNDPAELQVVRQEHPDAPDLAPCWSQREPARKLPNLSGTPILVLTSEASYHAVYDHCTARYLNQAGVKNSFVRLGDHGIHGNGHMMMLEKNNLEIAKLIDEWMRTNIR